MRIARAQYDAGMMRPLPREAFLQEDTYAKTRLPVDFAWTLIPDAYTSPDFHEVEREQVFAKSWIPVCAADEVAGLQALASEIALEIGERGREQLEPAVHDRRGQRA